MRVDIKAHKLSFQNDTINRGVQFLLKQLISIQKHFALTYNLKRTSCVDKNSNVNKC